MKYQLIKPFLFLFAVIMVVSLACGIDWGGDETTAPVEQPTISSSVESTPNSTVEPTQSPPTVTPEPIAQQYFTETFDENSGDWSFFMVNGETSSATEGFGEYNAGIDNGNYMFELMDENQYAYIKYDPYDYTDVRVDVVANNRGVNNNNVSIICRYTPGGGWYEFNIANNGLYNIFYAEYRQQGTKVAYEFLANGGSNKIRTGKETNTYTAICKGRTLSLEINGFEAYSFEENRFALSKGAVGLSVSSFNVLPVNVEIDEVTISEP